MPAQHHENLNLTQRKYPFSWCYWSLFSLSCTPTVQPNECPVWWIKMKTISKRKKKNKNTSKRYGKHSRNLKIFRFAAAVWGILTQGPLFGSIGLVILHEEPPWGIQHTRSIFIENLPFCHERFGGIWSKVRVLGKVSCESCISRRSKRNYKNFSALQSSTPCSPCSAKKAGKTPPDEKNNFNQRFACKISGHLLMLVQLLMIFHTKNQTNRLVVFCFCGPWTCCPRPSKLFAAH